ncbi:hypothetical protein H4R34_001066 [Dimargaris verticillata]|uniref:Fungal lipase-type domain-containing protein n=1 Tax=Dimargaris verticillata TaxID=2761393 RepID=A0A9W8B547_9FUNG|nr:hypothetical protein H4R34_001066 [Dimargaris verticillata]
MRYSVGLIAVACVASLVGGGVEGRVDTPFYPPRAVPAKSVSFEENLAKGYLKPISQDLKDELYKKRAYVMAAYALSDDEEQSALKKLLKRANVEFVSSFQFKRPEHASYVAVNHEEKIIAVVFRGALGSIALEQGFDSGLVSWPAYPGTSIHQGFLSGYSVGSEAIHVSFFSTFGQYPDYRVWVMGHSMGGIHATIAAMDLLHQCDVRASAEPDSVDCQKLGQNMEVTSFNRARFGDKALVDAFNALNIRNYRVSHEADVMGIYPNPILGYTQENNEIWFHGGTAYECAPSEEYETKYCHGSTEVDEYSMADHLLVPMADLLGLNAPRPKAHL